MCDYCSQIQLVETIDTPAVYERTIKYIKELIDKRGFVLIDGNCEIGKPKDKNGRWISDIIFHSIKCPRCKQVYACSVNTYKGGGFKKADSSPHIRPNEF